MRKFVPEFEGVDMEKLAPWIQDYLDGKLKVCFLVCGVVERVGVVVCY